MSLTNNFPTLFIKFLTANKSLSTPTCAIYNEDGITMFSTSDCPHCRLSKTIEY